MAGETLAEETAETTVDKSATDQARAEVAEHTEAPDLVRAREAHTLEQQLEALLLIADEPISAVSLATAVDQPVREVRRAVEVLIADYEGDHTGSDSGRQRGFELREVAGGYRFYVRSSLDAVVAAFVQQQSPSRLSQAALETLAVIAYRQPISRGAIGSVRAVNVDSVVRTLLGQGLIAEAGHDPDTGAILYGTNDALLGHLGLSSLDELPPIAPLLDDPSEDFDNERF